MANYDSARPPQFSVPLTLLAGPHVAAPTGHRRAQGEKLPECSQRRGSGVISSHTSHLPQLIFVQLVVLITRLEPPIAIA